MANNDRLVSRPSLWSCRYGYSDLGTPVSQQLVVYQLSDSYPECLQHNNSSSVFPRTSNIGKLQWPVSEAPRHFRQIGEVAQLLVQSAISKSSQHEQGEHHLRHAWTSGRRKY